jgi:hypothetical protein
VERDRKRELDAGEQKGVEMHGKAAALAYRGARILPPFARSVERSGQGPLS